MSVVDEDVQVSDVTISSQNSSSNEAASPESDLNAGFNEAIKGYLDFKGSFFHHSSHSWPDAPDPELTIEGVGPIALPLSEQDAQAVIGHASQAPFGKGTETVVDTAVRNTWEVDPAKVSFGNEKWEEFVTEVASKNIWESLGVAPFTTPPRCDLHKLLLYETGSHFLPHQDSSKAEGMFATVIIVLPCDFEGGEVRVSHGGKSATLDVAADAADCQFSVLAWYTDVVHEVKPVKSGYRLALSYNLIHTSPSLPPPTVALVDPATESLRRALQTWNDGGYKTQPKFPYLACVLSYEYSEAQLQNGEGCLKGLDAHIVENLLTVAKDLDFSVCLGLLRRTVRGDADEERKDGCFVMANIDVDIMTISKLVRISSDIPFKVGRFNMEDDSFIPKDFLERASPDEEEFEGYTGNDGAPLEWQYFRSVVLLFRNADQTAVVTGVKGLAWVLEHRESESLDLDIRIAAYTTLACLKEREPRGYHGRRSVFDGTAKLIAELAIDWKDSVLWCGVLNLGHLTSEERQSSLEAGIKLFDLGSIRPAILQYVIDYSRVFSNRLNQIKMISEIAGDKASPAWVDALTRDALAAYGNAHDSDADSLATLAHEKGFDIILDMLIPNLSKGDKLEGEYTFFINLAEALYNHKSSQPSSESESRTTVPNDGLIETIRKCLLESIARWQQSKEDYRRYNRWGSPVEPINAIVDTCLAVQDLEPCRQLLTSLLDLPPNTDVAAKFRDFYQPLVPALKAVLQKHGVEVTSEPFRTFFKSAISLYLERILGGVDSSPPLPRIELRHISDEGQSGQQFTAFVNSPERGPIQISGVPKDRLYWFAETSEVKSAPVIITTALTDRLRKTYTLTLEKKPEALVLYTWESRRAAAGVFLDSLTDNEGMAVIMGERYNAMNKALDGEMAFVRPGDASGSTA